MLTISRNILIAFVIVILPIIPISQVKAQDAGGMVLINGGCFTMGDIFNRSKMTWDSPLHEVCLDDFYMDRFEVSQEKYLSVFNELPLLMRAEGFKECNDCPVSNVSWKEADDYCRSTGKRLPTEAEWEYSARSGGKEQMYAGTDSIDELREYAVYKRYPQQGSRGYMPVCTKKGNELGLYDMNGNVSEWVADLYSRSYYKEGPKDNPEGPSIGMVFNDGRQYHVCRGGSFEKTGEFISTTNRNHCDQERDNVGFRCVK